MAIRRLNYTNRQRLLRQDTLVTLYTAETGPARFDIVLNLDDYGFPGDAPVVLEAYRQATIMRFDCGRAAAWQKPGSSVLTEFGPNDKILFRVKVIEKATKRGRLLAEGDRIPVVAPGEQPGNRVPLLPVEPAELGQLSWRLDFGGDDEPHLLVSNKFIEWQEAARSPQFMLLVYPVVIELVLTRVLLVDQYFDTDDLDNWRSRWLRFGSLLSHPDDELSEGDSQATLTGWIKDVASTFGRSQRLMQRFASSVLGGIEE